MPDTSSESEAQTSDEEVEMLATSRERRGNAGAKMASLLNQEDTDDFYKEAYGGFMEEEDDAGWASPAHSESDEVDSDFDQDETQAEPEEGPEDPDSKRPRRQGVFTKAYKEPATKVKRATAVGTSVEKAGKVDLALAISSRRLRSPHVPRPSSDKPPKVLLSRGLLPLGGEKLEKVKRLGRRHAPMSQEQRLREAKETEKLNLASLQKFRELETVEKLKRNKAVKKRPLQGPRIIHISRSSPKGLMESLMVYPSDTELRVLRARVPKAPRACVVSGLPARYTDPLTHLPFHDPAAFAAIRAAYSAFLAAQQ